MLKRVILELLILVVVCSIVTSGKERTKRDDNGNSIGNMIKTLLSKIIASEPSTQAPNNNTNTSSGNSIMLTNGTIHNTANDTVTNGGTNTSKQPNITNTSKKPTTHGVKSSTMSPKTVTMSPKTTSYPKMKTSTVSSTHTWSTRRREPEVCYINPYLKNFCSVPPTLKGISFWDLYSVMFSDTVLDTMLIECQKGEWCLRDRFDYWDALIAERVDMVQKSQIAASMCEDSVRECVSRVPANYSSCSQQRFKQMMYTSESIGMICKLRRNPDLSDDCYERVLQALHVTLADIIRGVKEGDTLSHTGDVCHSAEAHMTKAIICIANSCPAEAYAFRSFPPWAWFTRVVDNMINTCHLNTSICEALLQRGPVVWMPDGMIIGVIVVSLMTLSVTLFIGLIFWRKYRRNVVLKEGYQQLLNDDEKS